MPSRPEFIKDVSGQLLIFDATEGRPSATPSVGIKTSGNAELSAPATTNVTLNSVNTTVNATSAIGDQTLTLADTTGINVGYTYLVINAAGQSEWVRVTAVNSGTQITVDERLEYAYAATDAFVSTRFTYTLQSADYDTLRESAKATATYVVGGLNYTQVKLFDVVLFPLTNPLTSAGMKARWPDVMRQEHTEQLGEDFQRQRNLAWDEIQLELRQQGNRPGLVISREELESWGYSLLALRLQESGISIIRGEEPSDALDRLERRAERYKQDALNALTWLDADEDEGKDNSESENWPLDFIR